MRILLLYIFSVCNNFVGKFLNSSITIVFRKLCCTFLGLLSLQLREQSFHTSNWHIGKWLVCLANVCYLNLKNSYIVYRDKLESANTSDSGGCVRCCCAQYSWLVFVRPPTVVGGIYINIFLTTDRLKWSVSYSTRSLHTSWSTVLGLTFKVNTLINWRRRWVNILP